MTARLRLRDAAGTLRTITRLRIRDETGVLRTIGRIRIRDASNVLQIVYQNLVASISPPTTEGAYRGTSAAAQNIAVSSVIATPVGGTPAYTYAWVQVGSSAYTWTIGASTSATTDFTATSIPLGAVATATFQVTVTDSGGSTATATVTATARNISTA